MNSLSFEWDESKNISNQRKHGVSFEEASTVFTDELARLIPDPDHSEGEERFILMGVSAELKLLTVCHCEKAQTLFVLFQLVKLINLNENSMRNLTMRKSYDFSKSVKSPYAKRLKKQITIRLDENTILYFKNMAENKGIPYQSLINLYLRDCATEHRELKTRWS